jgi:antiviral defense system Shedu protein SduA
MALFNEIIPDKEKLLQEVELFRKFLATNPVGERAQFLPFFAQHPQLCGFLATMNDSVRAGTQVKSELSLWGDFTCDLVVGNLDDAAFVFIEFESAAQRTLFQSRPGRKNSHWGLRVEHGVSQVIDWLFRINTEGPSDRMERDFGARHITIMALRECL